MEVEHSKVLALLEELKTGKLPRSFGDGSNSRVYNKTTKKILDGKVEELCSKLQDVEDIKKYSPEMQIWWRDHKKADRARLKRISEAKKKSKDRQELVNRLTPYEKELLGIK
jgi:hypothetical protein